MNGINKREREREREEVGSQMVQSKESKGKEKRRERRRIKTLSPGAIQCIEQTPTPKPSNILLSLSLFQGILSPLHFISHTLSFINNK